MVLEHEANDQYGAPDGPEQRIAELPGGSAFGSAVHDLLEHARGGDWLGTQARDENWRCEQIELALRRHGVSLPGVSLSGDADEARSIYLGTANLIGSSLSTPISPLGCLADLPGHAQIAEMEFHFQLGNSSLQQLIHLLQSHGYATTMHSGNATHAHAKLTGLMHGYIDLVVEHQQQYYVIDYKTNWLGPLWSDYAPEQLPTAIEQHHYDVQYLIYLVALHRYLRRRIKNYAPQQHLGGALYLFLRGLNPALPGNGVFHDRPTLDLIEQLDQLLLGDQP